MRKFTDQDKRGLLVAVRVFLHALSGERLSQQAGIPLIEKLLEAGVSVDAFLNKENWGRALEKNPDLTFKDYVNMLTEGSIVIREIKDEKMWHETAYGFAVIAEAAHDFFMEITGRGGKWNIPSALTNLAKAIRNYSLQAVLSEELITRVIEGDEEMTYFGYILTVAEDFNKLGIADEPSEAQLARRKKENPGNGPEENAGKKTQQAVNQPEPEEPNDDEAPEDSPYPEMMEETGFETVVVTQANPDETKKATLRTVLGNYSPNEILGLVKTIDGGMDLPIDEILNRLAKGQFSVEMEDAKTEEIHRSINADLLPSFVDCINIQGREMNEELAAEYDILHDSWDMRTPEVRKLHKLLKLIYTEGKDDPDLLASVKDIEDLYAVK